MTLPLLKPAKLPPKTEWHQRLLADQEIGFMLKRSKRKSIGLRINDEGLLITAPLWTTEEQIQQALDKKSNWILDKLKQRSLRLEQQAMGETVWQNQGKFPYLGIFIELQLNPALDQITFSGQLESPTNQDRLCLHLAPEADSQRIQDLCHTWLQQQAQRHLNQRLHFFLQKCDYRDRFKNWRLANPAKRWGSCSSTGTIMLNWRLIHFEPAIIDYVVAHEIAHLKEMNHGPNFWQEVSRLVPNFYTARQQLKPFSPASLPLF